MVLTCNLQISPAIMKNLFANEGYSLPFHRQVEPWYDITWKIFLTLNNYAANISFFYE